MSWISVKDRLPESDRPVLIYCKNGAMFTGKMQDHNFIGEPDVIWFTYGPLGTGRRIANSRITHWMPLPEPPKEE